MDGRGFSWGQFELERDRVEAGRNREAARHVAQRPAADRYVEARRRGVGGGFNRIGHLGPLAVVETLAADVGHRKVGGIAARRVAAVRLEQRELETERIALSGLQMAADVPPLGQVVVRGVVTGEVNWWQRSGVEGGGWWRGEGRRGFTAGGQQNSRQRQQ